MINAAIIGVSGFGNIHYQDLLREHAAGRLNVIGAAIINQAEEQEKCEFLKSIGCRIFTDYREMLQELHGKIDLCMIPTGIAMHMPMTIAALKAGANVYVEKPVTATVEEAEKMEAASRETGKFIAVGYQTMYQPETRRIKELLLSGKIGKPYFFKTYALWPRDDAYYHRNNWAAHLGKPGAWILDSPFTNALAHYLNLLSFFAGKNFEGTADLTSVRAGLYRANAVESCDTVSIEAQTSDAKTLLFSATHCSENCVNPIIKIQGTAGSIEYDLSTTVVKDAAGNELERFDVTKGVEIREHIFQALYRRMEDPATFICTVAIAKNHTRLSNAVFDAAEIHTIPDSDFRVVTNEKGIQRRVINGIDEAIARSFTHSRLLNTDDYPWAVNSAPFCMKEYTTFQGLLLQK